LQTVFSLLRFQDMRCVETVYVPVPVPEPIYADAKVTHMHQLTTRSVPRK